jgi:hypothetical protein
MRILSMKISNNAIGNRHRDLPAYNAVPPPTAPPRAPYNKQVQQKTLKLNLEITLACITFNFER